MNVFERYLTNDENTWRNAFAFEHKYIMSRTAFDFAVEIIQSHASFQTRGKGSKEIPVT